MSRSYGSAGIYDPDESGLKYNPDLNDDSDNLSDEIFEGSDDDVEYYDEYAEDDTGRFKIKIKKHSPVGAVLTVLSWIGHVVVTILIALVLAVGVRQYVVEQFIVPTGSMLPTIQLNDRLLGEKLSYLFHEPKVGDVIMFEDPHDHNTMLCKRVIAVGGQEVDLVDGKVKVDGQVSMYGNGNNLPLESDDGTEILYPYRVPDGQIWVMGDNRESSADSRVFGSVSVDSVCARAWCIIAPKDHWRWL